MTRTERAKPSAQKQPKNANTAEARRTQLSRSLTKLLRHQAENERIPISPAGWVKLEDLLAWKGLSRLSGGNITVDEVFDVVQADGWTGKGRFEVKYIGGDSNEEPSTEPTASVEQGTANHQDDGDLSIDGAATGLTIAPTADHPPNTQPQPDPTSKNTPGTQSALRHQQLHPSTPVALYLIRASQGHSMKTIQSPDLLTPLTLSSSSIPSTIVHGTFYGAWSAILSTGGLKPMGRNNVHFATGPSLTDILNTTTTTTKQPLARDGVISGMRADAQILIYIDLARCLSDIETHSLDMKWYISGNGVVLTEGLLLTEKGGEAERMVPTRYWHTAVEVRNGLGVLWKYPEGVVRELPERLRDVPLPWGKGRQHGGGNARGKGKGKGGCRPGLNVERDSTGLVDDDGQLQENDVDMAST